jgi:hypothetical protein
VPLALLRATAWAALAVLIVDPGCVRAGDGAVTVLLDGSHSMTDERDSTRWQAAVDTARAIAGGRGRILLFGGEQPVPYAAGAAPAAASSRVLPALRLAAAGGGPVAVVTDGVVDDAAAIPADLLRAVRVVVVPRDPGPDAGVAALAVPPFLRAGDTALAVVDLAVAGTSREDTTSVELAEDGRTVVRLRVPLGAGGSLRRELRFVPAASDARRVRRYEIRLAGWPRDADARNDRLATVAAVAPTSAIVVVSDQPDWDVRALGAALGQTSGAPVRTFVRVSDAGWRDARTLRPAGEAAVQGEVARAALVVAHGTPALVQATAARARGAVVRWPVGAPREGDWYVAGGDAASPVGSALAGVPVESLPPLELQRAPVGDTTGWTALLVRRDRRGGVVPAIAGRGAGARRRVDVGATGLWRWAARGGVAGETYRALVAALTDWVLAGGTPEQQSLAALRDSLAQGATELLPRAVTLAPRAGEAGPARTARLPLRHTPWLYLVVIGALVIEWTARRRAGLR